MAFTPRSVMNVGTFSTDYVSSMSSSTFAPRDVSTYLFELLEFGFGKTDETAQTEYYEDLKNTDDAAYGFWANSTSLALNFRGLGLPSIEFKKFMNLLSIISKGESTCIAAKSGYCVLSDTCDAYYATGLWDYDFKINFGHASTKNYIRVPLASFAANSDAEGGLCAIFVEFLDDRFDDSKTIIFGGMFFQSIYAQYTMAGVNAVSVTLFENLNALPQTYVGSKTYATSESVFKIPTAVLNSYALTDRNGLPSFAASVAGITDYNQYFYLDFGSSHTYVWSTTCETTSIGEFPAGSCEDAPTLMERGFDGSYLPQQVGTFSYSKTGGFIVSGTSYTSELCFGDINCKFVTVYGVDQVSADNWLYDTNGAYGIIGAGPRSHIWEGFVDNETKKASYSIELARVHIFSSS